MCQVLAKVEQAGCKIDLVELTKFEDQYGALLIILKDELQTIAKEVMGDTPINLNSPEQLSRLIYSRKILNKKRWSAIFGLKSKFTPAFEPGYFNALVRAHTEILYKTIKHTCTNCSGKGTLSRILKSGKPAKHGTKCPVCSGIGILYDDSSDIAGLQCSPPNSSYVTALGFSTSSAGIEELIKTAKGKYAKEFLTKLGHYSAITTYRNTYCAGIRKACRGGSTLHGNILQHITRTGRLSSQAPNLHNQPRGTDCSSCGGDGCRYCLQTGKRFPIRKVFISRFTGGRICKADYSRLEFAIAADLAQCPVALAHLKEKDFDPHAYSAKIIGVPRAEAKAHTFKPLYGGTSGTKREREYYKWFTDHYTGIGKWQQQLLEKAVRTKQITIPSGRTYKFPHARQYPSGAVAGGTKIKNYPVQGFATADIVPLSTIEVERIFSLRGLSSRIINEVHDEIVWDAPPDELDECFGIVKYCMEKIGIIVYRNYGYKLTVELKVECAGGLNWLETEDYHVKED